MIRRKYFEISIFLVLHFLFVFFHTPFNHISANFEDVVVISYFTRKEISEKDLAFFLTV